MRVIVALFTVAVAVPSVVLGYAGQFIDSQPGCANEAVQTTGNVRSNLSISILQLYDMPVCYSGLCTCP